MVIFLYLDRLVPYGFIVNGLITVILFFSLHHILFNHLYQQPEQIFLTRIFVLAIIFRISAAIALYFFYKEFNGEPFEFNAVDSKFYHLIAKNLSTQFRLGNFDISTQLKEIPFSDRGYPVYLGVIYSIFGPGILATRIINAIISILTVLYSYKLSKLLFGNIIGRSSAISILLLPNLHLYLGTHLKETTMLFLAIMFLYQCVKLVKLSNHTWQVITLICLTGFTLFMYRTMLGTVCILSFVGYFITNRPLKRKSGNILAAFTILSLLFYMIWNSEIGVEISEYLTKSSTAVTDNLEFRASRDGGNKFALLAGAPLFMIIILITPFASFVAVPEQELIWMFIGANMIRNIYSFFTIAGLYYIARNNFRNSSLLIYYTVGYFGILANSGFAISERFHLPVVPILLIFASVGLTHQNKTTKKIFPIYLILITVLTVGWNYIKLAGRGL
jgi:4-amino-4-deoxy-L-arabinose transferase-like glycosyltransferase